MAFTAPQTAVAAAPDYAVPGQLASLRSVQSSAVDTMLNEEASAHIPFGRVVKKGTVEKRAKVPSAKTDQLCGITVFGHSYSRTPGAVELDNAGLAPGTHMSVLVCGEIYVMPEEDVAITDQVHARVITNVAKLPGMIGKTDDGVNTIDISAFAQWKRAGGPTSGQCAVLWVDFSNAHLAVTDS